MPEPAAPSDALRTVAAQLGSRLAAILACLQPCIAAHLLRHPWVLPAAIAPLWNRIGRYGRRFTRLMDRIAAGRFPAPRRPEQPATATPAPARSRPPAPPIPRAHGWLLNALGWRVAVWRNQLGTLLAEPAMAELLATCPSAGRTLRPLCHMLGLPAPCSPPPRPPRAASPKPAHRRVPKRLLLSPSNPRLPTPPSPLLLPPTRRVLKCT